MQRYFLPPEQMDKASCYITGNDVHHIRHVMRFKPGERIICCDGLGRSALAEIKAIGPNLVECTIIDELDEERELPIRVVIAQALPKGDKMEWILQKGTELGAAGFIPFVSQRTVVKYDEEKFAKKRMRWQSIIKEAAEQSHRQRLPQVTPLYSLQEMACLQADLKLVADEERHHQSAGASPFVQALSQLKPGQEVLIAFGPEGGFERGEIALLEEQGFIAIALGRRILRTETASQYVLASISFYFEQMGGLIPHANGGFSYLRMQSELL